MLYIRPSMNKHQNLRHKNPRQRITYFLSTKDNCVSVCRWCQDSCPAWSCVHESQHQFFNTKGRHEGNSVQRCWQSAADQLEFMERQKRKKVGGGGKMKHQGCEHVETVWGLFSPPFSWPAWWEEITSVTPGAYWNQYLIKGLDKVPEAASSLSTSSP